MCDLIRAFPSIKGADVNSKDRSGNIPLHAAAKAGKMDMVKHLISIGADVARRNNYHQTPYDVSTSHIVRQYLLPLQLRVRVNKIRARGERQKRF